MNKLSLVVILYYVTCVYSFISSDNLCRYMIRTDIDTKPDIELKTDNFKLTTNKESLKTLSSMFKCYINAKFFLKPC